MSHTPGLQTALFSDDGTVTAVANALLHDMPGTELHLDPEFLNHHRPMVDLLCSLVIELQNQIVELDNLLLEAPKADYNVASLDVDSLSAFFTECRLAADSLSMYAEPISKFVRDASMDDSKPKTQCIDNLTIPESVYLYPIWLDRVATLAFCAINLLEAYGKTVSKNICRKTSVADSNNLRILRCFDSQDPASRRTEPIKPCRESGHLDIKISCGSFNLPLEWNAAPDTFVCYTPSNDLIIAIEPIDNFAQLLRRASDLKNEDAQSFEKLCEGLDNRIIADCPDGRLQLPAQMLTHVGLSPAADANGSIASAYYRYELYDTNTLEAAFANIDLSAVLEL